MYPNVKLSIVEWNLPGGKVEFGESVREAAVRELSEETGIETEATRVLSVTEVLLQEQKYQSVTIAFLGRYVSGAIQSESGHAHGKRMPAWFKPWELAGMVCHPKEAVGAAVRLLTDDCDLSLEILQRKAQAGVPEGGR